MTAVVDQFEFDLGIEVDSMPPAGYTGDPLQPDLVTVTPPDVVATLTGPQREERVQRLIEQAHYIVDWAWEVHGVGRSLAASCVLYSGGNDSTVLSHLMRHRVDYAVHCNTTIGIEQTRQFVPDTCSSWNLELIERFPPKSYRELVKERGFPGPAMHFLMYSRIKERQLEAVRNELVSNPRKERVLFIAGRRRSESNRRANVALADRKGSMVFASPLAMWTKLDMNTYRLMHRESDPVPLNEVSQLLHMSGECLCGAFAKENELDEIRMWFPDVAAEIDSIMADVKAAGHDEPWCTWGHRKSGPGSKLFLKGNEAKANAAAKDADKVGLMCSSCEFTLL